MKIDRKPIDLCSVLRATDRAQEAARIYAECTNDPRRPERLEVQECRVCFYARSRIGGATCSEAPCGLCGKMLYSGNTCVDVLCKDCARDKRLCVLCGGDVEMKNRRRL